MRLPINPRRELEATMQIDLSCANTRDVRGSLGLAGVAQRAAVQPSDRILDFRKESFVRRVLGRDSGAASFFQRFGPNGGLHGLSIAACRHVKQGWLSKSELDGFTPLITARTAELTLVYNCAFAALLPAFVLPSCRYSFSRARVFAQYAGNASAPQLVADCAAKAIPLNKIATLDTGRTCTLTAELIGMRQNISELLATIKNTVLYSIPTASAGISLRASPARFAIHQFRDYVRNLVSTFGEAQHVAEVI
jgi:hypothetical protein